MSNYFAGLDWASQIHALCVIDEHGASSSAARSPMTRPGSQS